MLTSIIAVIGTLAGAVTAGLMQQRAARRDRVEAREAEQRRDRLNAVTALAAALADHRRAMWVREDLRLSEAPDAAYEAARAESHATRAAITAPLASVTVLAPELGPAADAAARATYALRAAPDAATLAARRTAAIEAAERLVAEAAALS
ncbi:protein kilB [Streptomyces sp. NPDC018031]|uniref:protein kilB n=1 Tax=Streptomyces sp. NPDC018031 TaxID=3365033 RepID=UPI00379CE607